LKKTQRWCWPAVTFVLLIVAGLVLLLNEEDYLLRIEEHNLFLNTPLFLRQCMVKSGGLLVWLGTFLTQMLYYPKLGVSLLVVLWGVLALLLRSTFRLPWSWLPLTLLPIAMLLLSNVTLGYLIFYLKLRGFFFIGTVGTLIVVALLWLYLRLPARWPFLRWLFLLLTVAVGYPLLGFYALLACTLMALAGWRTSGPVHVHIVSTLVAVIAILAIPYTYYYILYYETPLESIYTTALPVFQIYQKDFYGYYAPYMVLFGSLALMSIMPLGFFDIEKGPRWRRVLLSPRVLGLAGGALLVVALVRYWYTDENFHRELAMSRAIDEADWERVVQLGADTSLEPTRAICMMRNLALFRLGRQGDEMYTYPSGNKPANCPFPPRIVQTEGKKLYLHYGVTNFCYRWCIEDGVEYGWNIEVLRLLIKCSLLTGERKAAQKYISLLHKTTFHHRECSRYEALLRNPRLIVRDRELRPILPMLRADDDYLTSDESNIERFLLRHFTSAESRNPIYQEQTLLAAMQMKDMRLFWPRFYQYTEIHRGQQVPRHYQEAACLYGHLSQEVDISTMPFTQKVRTSCEEFLSVVENHKGSSNRLKSLLRPKFHDTFYYDYFFNRFLEGN